MLGSIGNIPYGKGAEPFELIFKQTAILDYAGQYVFAIDKQYPTPNINIMLNSLYYIWACTFAADVAEADFHGAMLISPVFSLYVSNDMMPILKNPIDCPLYYNGLIFRKGILVSTSTGDQLVADTSHFLGTFQGTFVQTPALIGKQDMTLTMILSVQEIGDRDFITQFHKGNRS